MKKYATSELMIGSDEDALGETLQARKSGMKIVRDSDNSCTFRCDVGTREGTIDMYVRPT